MRVSISPLAERDLEAIGDYIADDNPARAVSFVAELRDQVDDRARIVRRDGYSIAICRRAEMKGFCFMPGRPT